MQATFADANTAARRLLEASGVKVVSVAGQTCCGAIHYHSGETADAVALARQNIMAFEKTAADYIVNTAGGCGAMLSEYHELLANDPLWAERARQFSRKVRDFSTILLDPRTSPLAFVGARERVALQNSCHLVNVAKAGRDPVALLARVEGDQVVQYPGQEICCGSGGVYNLNHKEWAAGILDQKMAALAKEQPQRILVNNPGCHLQMQWGVRRLPGLGAEVEHLASYLWRAHERAQA